MRVLKPIASRTLISDRRYNCCTNQRHYHAVFTQLTFFDINPKESMLVVQPIFEVLVSTLTPKLQVKPLWSEIKTMALKTY